eukprot:gene7803-12277_t
MNIFKICSTGDLDKLKKLLERAEKKGLDISQNLNHKNYFGRTALHYCFRFGRLNCAKFIIENYEPNLLVQNKNKWNILHDAARFGNTEILHWFLNLKGKEKEISQLVKMKNQQSSIPLYSAILAEDIDCVQLLYPISPLNILNTKLHTPLLLALTAGNIPIIHYVLDQGGCDILQKDKNSANSIFYCCYYEFDEMLEILKRILKMLKESNKYGVCLLDKNKFNCFHFTCFLNSPLCLLELLNFYHDYEIERTKITELHPLDIENIDGTTPRDLAKDETKKIIETFSKDK